MSDLGKEFESNQTDCALVSTAPAKGVWQPKAKENALKTDEVIDCIISSHCEFSEFVLSLIHLIELKDEDHKYLRKLILERQAALVLQATRRLQS